MITRIVIVDDDMVFSETIEKTIKYFYEQIKEPVSVNQYSKGSILLDELSMGRSFDNYFMDVEMPEIDGLELARRIKNVEADADIFLTAALYRGIYLLLCAVFLCVVARFACRWMKAVIGLNLKWKWLFVPPILLCMVYFQRIYLLLVSEQVMRSWWVFLSGNILMILVFTGYFFIRKEKERNGLQQLKMEMMEYDYQALRRVYEEKEILLHDVKKHMQVIWGMVEAEQILSWHFLLRQ